MRRREFIAGLSGASAWPWAARAPHACMYFTPLASISGIGIRFRYRQCEKVVLHSITSSARPSSGVGTVIPKALAVLRFITNLVLLCLPHRNVGRLLAL
jgi:hypothetical protein